MFLSYVRAVLWSFFGIRRRAGAEAEIGRLSPVVLALVAVLLAGLFVLGLNLLARWASGGGLG